MANNSFGAIPPLTINGGAIGAGSLLSQVKQSNVVIGNNNPFAGLNTINISSDWDNPNVKRYEVIETSKDLLSLSTAWYRIRKARTSENVGTVFPEKLLDKVLFNEVNEEDIQLAANIRDYYSKKIMMWTLKGQKLTRFREDMNKFIHTDGTSFREDMIPLVYRLPEFYEYDLEFTDMYLTCNKKVENTTDKARSSRTLELMKTLNTGKRYSKRTEFWFNDEHNNLVTISVQKENPLLPLFFKVTKDPLKVEASLTKRYRDDNEYLIADKLKFI